MCRARVADGDNYIKFKQIGADKGSHLFAWYVIDTEAWRYTGIGASLLRKEVLDRRALSSHTLSVF